MTFVEGLLTIYVSLTASQFSYTVWRDYRHLQQTREHSRKLIEAQQSVSRDALKDAWHEGYKAAVTGMKEQMAKVSKP